MGRVHGRVLVPPFLSPYSLLIKSHLQSYPCPLQINFFWNFGFLLGVAIILQIITGILLSLHYTSDISGAYFSIFFIIREVFFGWSLRYLHSSGASVITNLLSPFPCVIEWVSGGYCVHNPTLKRFFIFHFILPFILCGFTVIHIFYLHLLSSNNPLRNSTNNKIPFFPFIFQKDVFGLIIVLTIYFLQTNFGISSLSHPDNALEACPLLTPLHIVPEWYFLCQYAMLKAIPNKNSGFIILLTSILLLFIFGEIRNITSLVLLNNNGFLLSFFFFITLCFLWIGAQFPQEKFLSYARILTLYYYFVLLCILLSFY